MDKKRTLQKIGAHYLQEEAKKKGYDIEFLHEEKNIFFIKKNGKEILFKGVDGGLTSKIARSIAIDKDITHLLLKRNHINYPKYIIVKKDDIINNKKIETLEYPLVTKPIDSSLGKGVVVNIRDKEQLNIALKYSFEFGNNIMIQEFVEGINLRILVINYRTFAGLQRIRHNIIGDGESTIKELLEKENLNPKRGDDLRTYTLPKIKINNSLELFFQTQYKVNFGDILEKDRQIFLKGNGYSSVIDITDDIPVEISKICEDIARIFKLPVAGVDVIYNKDTKKYRILEVNSQPGIRTHHLPMAGKARNVAGAILDLYFK